ncbi:13143_t:CDS:10 [Entrophospora sp. SA101]|nr:13143_t:CDS:10 [Entrophospora sp. SA101]
MGKISKKKESKKSILAFPIDNNKITDLNNDLNNQKDMTSEDILPVIKQLSSLDANERAWAASCASHLVLSDPGTRRLLLSKNLIRSLIERLTDNVYEVIFEVIGTLRNLTVVGEYDICAEMFNKNILTPLITLIPKISVVINNILKGIPQESDPFVAARSTIWKFAENIICIFWSLSETSQKILRSINNANIISFLLAFFTPSELIPTQTIIAAAQCLNTLTDENPDIYFHFKNNPEYLKLLYYHINSEIGDNKTSDDHLNVKVLSCGILSNIRSILSPSLLPSLFSDINFYIIPVLIPCLSFDIQKCAEDAIETANNIETSDTLIKGSKDAITPTPKEVKLNFINSKLTNLQLVLELISKICLEILVNTAVKVENMEDDTPMLDTENSIIDNDNDKILYSQKKSILETFTTIILPALIRLAAPTKLSFQEQMGPNVMPPPTIAPIITSSLAIIHLRAIECMNNFFLSMIDFEDKFWYDQHKDDVKQLSITLIDLANQVAGKGVKVGAEDPGQEMRGSILEALVGCLWTLARGLDGYVPFSEAQIETFIVSYHHSISDSMRVKIIGTLGVVARRQNAVKENKIIGDFMINVLQNLPPNGSTILDCAIEALNAIYDIYADKNFDYDQYVFVQGNYLNLLQNIMDPFRVMVKSIDKRNFRDQRLRADEALINLVAFIKYKKEERN